MTRPDPTRMRDRPGPAAPAHGCNMEIQALRAVAVAGVVLSHAAPLWPRLDALLRPFELGSCVDLFFAISGFVIMRSLAPALHGRPGVARGPAIAAFYVRRGLRILPSAWLWMAVVVALSLGFNRSGSFAAPAANLSDAAAVALNVANWHFHACYYGGAAGCGNNAIYWSLSLEEQFYLLLPLAACLRRRWLVAVLATAVAVQLPLARTPLLLMTRSDALCLGVLLALLPAGAGGTWPAWLRHRWAGHRWLLRAGVAAGLAALVLVCGPAALGARGWGVAALLSAAILFLASRDRGWLIADGAPRRALAWLGQRSFAIYLIHNPLIWAAQEVWWRLGDAPPPWAVAILAAAAAGGLLALAELNFRLVETPLMRRGRHLADRIAGAAPGAGAAARPAAALQTV